MKTKNILKEIIFGVLMCILLTGVLHNTTSKVDAAEATEDDVIAVTAGGATTYYENFGEAMEVAETLSGQVTLKLIKDSEWDGDSYKIDWPAGDYILDLNGYTLKMIDVVYLNTGAELIVRDSAGEGIFDVSIKLEGGILTVENGTIQRSSGRAIQVYAGSTLNINGGEINGSEVGIMIWDPREDAMITVNITGGVINKFSNNIVIDRVEYADVVIAGGTFTEYLSTGDYMYDYGCVAGEIIPTNRVIVDDNGAKVDYKYEYYIEGPVHIIPMTPELCSHENGNLTEANCHEQAVCKDCNGHYGELGDHVVDIATGNCTVSGCGAENVAKASVSQGESTLYYKDIFEAIDKAGSIEDDEKITIKLLDNMPNISRDVIFPGKNIELDLNGKTLALNMNTEINLLTNCNLTILDSAGTEGKISIQNRDLYVSEGESLSLQGGTIEFGSNSCIYVSDGIFNMSGGKVLSTDIDNEVVCVWGGCNVKISGGEISYLCVYMEYDEYAIGSDSLSGGFYSKILVVEDEQEEYITRLKYALAEGCNYVNADGEIIDINNSYEYELENVSVVCSHVESRRSYVAVDNDNTIISKCGVCDKEMARITLTAEDSSYSGTDKAASVTGDTDIIQDYTLHYTGNGYDSEDAPINSGEYTVTMTVDGISVSDTFTIEPITIVDAMVTVEPNSVNYDGSKHIPEITVEDAGNLLEEDVDYTVSWDKTGFVEAGTYNVIITGKGNYAGVVTKAFVINEVSQETPDNNEGDKNNSGDITDKENENTPGDTTDKENENTPGDTTEKEDENTSGDTTVKEEGNTSGDTTVKDDDSAPSDATLKKVKAVEELISKLPTTITKNDEAAIKEALAAYNALSEAERKLLDKKLVMLLEAAKAEMEKLNKTEADKNNKTEVDKDNKTENVDSPDTGDNHNMWIWFAMLLVSGVCTFGYTLKKKMD